MYKSKIQTVILNKINQCFDKNHSSKFCNNIQHEYFYIDVAQLPQINAVSVLGLLSATSTALRQVGLPVNAGAAMTAAQDILTE